MRHLPVLAKEQLVIKKVKMCHSPIKKSHIIIILMKHSEQNYGIKGAESICTQEEQLKVGKMIRERGKKSLKNESKTLLRMETNLSNGSFFKK